MENLNLDVNKNRELSSPIKLRQRDKNSHVIHANIFDHGLTYNLSGKKVQFNASKPDGTVIQQAAQLNGNAIEYTLPEQATAVPGKVKCYFTILNDSGDVVDSTATFFLDVESGIDLSAGSKSYIETIDSIITSLRNNIDSFKNTANQEIETTKTAINNLSSSLSSQINAKTEEAIRNAVSQAKGYIDTKQKDIDASKSSFDTKLAQLNSQLDSLKQDLADKNTAGQASLDKINQIKSDAESALTKLNSDAQTALNSIDSKLASLVNDKWTVKSADIDSKYASHIKELDSSWNTLTAKANEQSTEIANKNTEAQSLLSSISTAKSGADSVLSKLKNDSVSALEELKNNSDAIVKQAISNNDAQFTELKNKAQNILDDLISKQSAIKSTYSRDEIDSKLAEAGKVKTVNSVPPDGKGNINIDTSGKVKTVQGQGPDANGNIDLPKQGIITSYLPGWVRFDGIPNDYKTPLASAAVIKKIGDYAEETYAKKSDLDNVGKVKTVNGNAPDNKGNVNVDTYSKAEVDSKVANAGKVKTVQGEQPDSNGNVSLPDLNVAYDFNYATGEASLAPISFGSYNPVVSSAITSLLKTGLPNIYAKKDDVNAKNNEFSRDLGTIQHEIASILQNAEGRILSPNKSVKSIIYLTQAEYDSKKSTGTLDEDAFYFIPES